jgi:mannose-1-phosphate guanylyltransferase
MTKGSAPTKAFVLAAGLGTRMLPLSRATPKPLMPIWGVPVLDHVLALLRRWGVREVLVNLHHLPNEVFNHLVRGPSGLRIDFSHEPEILGTGGALQKAAWFFDDQPFWMLNADVAADLEPDAMLNAFKPGRTIAAAWLHPSAGPRSVEASRGMVTTWRSKRPGTAGTYTFCGLHLVSPEILAYLPPTGFSSIIAGYEKAMAAGRRIAGVVVPDAFWADIGTPAQYLDAHRAALDCARDGKPGRNLVRPEAVQRMQALAGRGVRVSGFAAVGAGARVARGAVLCDCAIWDGASIGSGGRVENAIVGAGAAVREPVAGIALRAGDALDAAEAKALARVGWPGDRTLALPLGPRGSARTFTRLRYGGDSAILIRYNPKREENVLYAGHARFLRGIGLAVPAVLYDSEADAVTLFEDLGDRSVQVARPGLSASGTKRLYERILDQVLAFHERGAKKARARGLRLVPAFRPTLYRWEHDLFIDHFLRKRMGLSEAEIALLRRDLGRVARHLADAPAVLVHRDLQSSNILLRGRDPWFIDFQGMRYGPAVYDLASLLCDPYVELPAALQEELLAYYADRCPHPILVRRIFWHAAVQRLGQALGAYARLSESAETGYFKKYIPPAMEMIARAVSRVPDLPALARWCGQAARGVGLE